MKRAGSPGLDRDESPSMSDACSVDVAASDPRNVRRALEELSLHGVDQAFSRDETTLKLFGPIESVVHAWVNKMDKRGLSSPAGVPFRINVLGATWEHEVCRWRTFAAFALRASDEAHPPEICVRFVGPAVEYEEEYASLMKVGSSSGERTVKLTASTHQGRFPKDFSSPCDLFLAFNAGLVIGKHWAPALREVLAVHRNHIEHVLRAKNDRVVENFPSVPPPIWFTDYNEEAAQYSFDMLAHLVASTVQGLEELFEVKIKADLIKPYANPYRDTTAVQMAELTSLAFSNCYAFAFVGFETA